VPQKLRRVTCQKNAKGKNLCSGEIAGTCSGGWLGGDARDGPNEYKGRSGREGNARQLRQELKERREEKTKTAVARKFWGPKKR